MLDSIRSAIRSNQFLYSRLRVLKYSLWSTPIIGKIVPDLQELLQMEEIGNQTPPEALVRPGGGPKILFFTLRGWSIQVAWDVALAAALRLRGADVSFFTCGKRLPLCDIASYEAVPPLPCSFCATYMNRALNAWHFPTKRLRDYIQPAEIKSIEQQVDSIPYEDYDNFIFDEIPVGQLVTISVRWFLCSGTIGNERLARHTYRNFLISGAMMVLVGKRLLDDILPDKLYLFSGLFFAERIMLELARKRNLSVITHEAGFMPNTVVIAHDKIASRYDLDDVWPDYAEIPLTQQETTQLDEYLFARKSGKRDAATYYPAIEKDEQTIATRLDLDRSKKLVTVFTNILWDSAALDRETAFASMADWLDQTLQYFLNRSDVQLVIRIHPAEVRLEMHTTREKIAPFLTERYPTLPAHIKLIPPESDVSSYTLMRMSDVGLVYTSTTGLEMALEGKPVLVSGWTHYARKGFTYDIATRDEYLSILNHLDDLTHLSPEAIEYARRYAYLFFFRLMLPFPAVSRLPRARLQFNFERLSELRPGLQPEMDLICTALLENKPFVRPRETP